MASIQKLSVKWSLNQLGFLGITSAFNGKGKYAKWFFSVPKLMDATLEFLYDTQNFSFFSILYILWTISCNKTN